MFTQKFTCSNFRSSYFCVLVVGYENLDLVKISHYTVLHYACTMQHKCLSLTGKPVSVKQVNTRVHPMLTKLPLIPPDPNCGTWLWIIVHKAQLHCRLCIALSPDPASVKSHALSATTTSPNHLISNTSSLVIHPVTSEFIVELLIRESTDILHAKNFLYPVSSWSSPLLLVIASHLAPVVIRTGQAIPI